MQDKWPKGRVLLAIEGNRAFRPIFGVLGVVWQKLRGGFPVFVRALSYVANMSTNRRQGFLCWRTANMEQAADTAGAAAVDHYLYISVQSAYENRETD